MKKLGMIIVALCFSFLCFGQEKSLTLEDCYRLTIENSPFSKSKAKNEELKTLKEANLKTAYLPSLTINAQATYQSDVTSLSIPIPTVKMSPVQKDQYKATFDISQLIWDGGTVKALQNIENSSLEVDNQSVEVKLYQTKERVNQVFFSILILQKKTVLLETLKKDIEAKLKCTQSGIANGMILASNEDQLKAEILKIEQQLSENQISISSTFKVLNQLTGKDFPVSTDLQIPQFEQAAPVEVSRPELLLFEKQSMKLDALSNQAKSERMPKLMAFGQLGYGRPGLNMLNNEFDTYYYVGAKFTWNVFDWKVSKRKLSTYSIQKEMLTIEKQNFDQNLAIAAEQYKGQIEQYNDLIKKDLEIISLREKITRSASSQYESGVIRSSDYITEANNEISAKLNLELHKIMLLMAQASFHFIYGK
jgi:outer membrane protein TolC